ncbi:hypothetical protein GUITHDRAFT_105376 [Guillardia theta CCMP2712]|uniref:phosphatidyl-N-methylethanolamine N-methyltransferase n=1 Tax=Guillardia theta (strain CCMP2712) TaxID=905079 RepID=L1JK99_GUITC|nr:hypothetical protein GUITHDRAFT_105376 [Guillardia theta CCMP2712]EKX48747.1 hypothetical protein GUITHDRAFT_105376 [Guillardia theta CCMP2712]|mmetsp:Transcript_17142/g.56804  ORF Transcript_17142/g.56804 Transcript_17142/m.56804 type:complete len:184 (-) Transcript_17142:34-585(-)|eukprot:XP_005835727.1 hypothetical protein GUITHDRAFT_105376 [Guillardia theta CCMP2712]
MAGTAAACAAIAVPHVVYLIMWTRPEIWLRRCKRIGRDPCREMAWWMVAMKGIQAIAVLLWLWKVEGGSGRLWWETWTFNLYRAFAVVLFCAGQFLNVACYKALGLNGIYYGVKYGKKVPWSHEWPYGGKFSLRHPQYVASVMTVWCAMLLLSLDVHYLNGAYVILGFWTACYVATALSEDLL